MNNYRPHAVITPAVKIIIILNAVMFLLTEFLERSQGIRLSQILGLHLIESQYWAPYQYITHMFMHGNLSHVFFNMFAVFMFGRVLENVWGTKRFLFFYFFAGIGAAFLHSLVGMFEVHSMMNEFNTFMANPEPGLLADFIRSHIAHPNEWVWKLVDAWLADPDSLYYVERGKELAQMVVDTIVNIPTIGASGAVFGILLAFGMLFPNTELFIMFIPIPIKAKYLVIGYGLLELLLGLQNNIGDNVAHFAHLGGMIFGFILIKYWNRKNRRFY